MRTFALAALCFAGGPVLMIAVAYLIRNPNIALGLVVALASVFVVPFLLGLIGGAFAAAANRRTDDAEHAVKASRDAAASFAPGDRRMIGGAPTERG